MKEGPSESKENKENREKKDREASKGRAAPGRKGKGTSRGRQGTESELGTECLSVNV